MNTENGNKLIAEFIGAAWVEDDYGCWGYKSDTFPSHFKMWDANALKYHTSWDWLHPVIDKIKRMQGDPSECFMGTTVDRHINFRSVTEMPITIPIIQAWVIVIIFIEWYNIQVGERKSNKSENVQVSDTTMLNQGTKAGKQK